MLNIHFRELETPRLVLRRLTMADLPLYYSRLASSPVVTEHMLWTPHTSLSESETSIQKAMARYESGLSCRWVIAPKSTGELIGIIDLMAVDTGSNICTFAYMLGENFWGHGFGTEAVKAVLNHAFSACGAAVVQVDHFAENGASGAVMRKAGMMPIGNTPGKYSKNSIVHDAVQFKITKEDWMPPR